MLVVSPHLDDGVFSCGELIACHPGTLVATVFSSAPPGFEQLTDWDAASGFLNTEEAISLRKQEDYAALHTLSAVPLWLDFFDSQYNDTPTVATVSAALQDVIENNQPETILFPIGLFHSDHLLAHQAVLALTSLYLQKNWIVYEDALYRLVAGALQLRLAELLQAGIQATPVQFDISEMSHLKQQAVHCYASQIQALTRITSNGYADALAPERYWRLAPMQAQVNKANPHGQH